MTISPDNVRVPSDLAGGGGSSECTEAAAGAVHGGQASLAPGQLTLRANFSWTFVGNTVYAGCQWAMLIVIAKLGNPEMLGQFTLGFAITTPIIILANLGLRRVQATDARGEYCFGHYLGLRILSTAFALFCITVIVVVSRFSAGTKLVIMLVGLSKAFEAISDTLYGLLQLYERMDRIAKSMMIKGPVSLTALGVMLYLSGNIAWGTVGLAAAWGLVLVVYDMRAVAVLRGLGLLPVAGGADKSGSDCFRPLFDGRRLLSLSLTAAPLGFVELLDALNINVPRYFLQHYHGLAALGFYGAVGSLMQAGGSTVALALSQAAMPRLAKTYLEDLRAFKRLLVKLLLASGSLGAAGILVALVFGRVLLAVLFRPEYAQHYSVLVWLMVAAALWYLAGFLFCSVTAARRFNVQVVLFMLMVGATTAACALLVPRHALLGAAWALCIGMTVRLTSYAIVSGLVILERAKQASATPVEGT